MTEISFSKDNSQLMTLRRERNYSTVRDYKVGEESLRGIDKGVNRGRAVSGMKNYDPNHEERKYYSALRPSLE